MAVLKQIKFGTGAATPIAQTVVTAASDSVLSVNGTNTKLTDDANPSYEVDLKIDNATLVKSSDSNKVLKVGTVPAAQVSVDKTDAGITATDAQAAFKELKTAIDNVDGKAKSYSIIDETSDLPENVLKRYRLQETVGSDKKPVGEPIDILKDNSLLAAKLSTMNATWNGSAIVDGEGAEALVLVYKDANGAAQVIHIDVSSFLKESEFGDGLKVTNGVVSVKIDPNSEKDSQEEAAAFLTVSADGIKISGINDEINRKIAALDVDDTAKAGQYVSQVSEADGKIAVERANVSDAKLNGYAKGTAPAAGSEAVTAGDDVKGAIAKLEHQVDAAKAAATTKVVEGTDAGNNMEIASAKETDGSTTYTINLTDVASKAALDAEIAARKLVDGQDGQNYVANTGTNYISVAKSLNDADVKLDAALKAEADRAKNAETSIDAAIGLTKGENNETRTYANTGEYIGKETSNTVASDIKALDTKLKEVAVGLAAVQYKVNGTTLEFYGMTEHA